MKAIGLESLGHFLFGIEPGGEAQDGGGDGFLADGVVISVESDFLAEDVLILNVAECFCAEKEALFVLNAFSCVSCGPEFLVNGEVYLGEVDGAVEDAGGNASLSVVFKFWLVVAELAGYLVDWAFEDEEV